MTAADKETGNFADDIVTRLIETDIDGEVLDETGFAFFVILLAVAGNETTRNAMTHGMNAFFDSPDQWELFKRERPETAVDEIIRWAIPVHCFHRTALTDNVIGDVTIRRGQHLRVRYPPKPQPALGVQRQRSTLLHRRETLPAWRSS